MNIKSIIAGIGLTLASTFSQGLEAKIKAESDYPVTSFTSKEEIDDFYINEWQNNPVWDRDKEVMRVMMNPKAPRPEDPNWEHYNKWQRSSYQKFIDAARTDRLGDKTGVINVPGNVLGKDELTIKYWSGWTSKFEVNNIGENYDILSLLSKTANSHDLTP